MDVKTAGRTVEMFEIFARTREPLSLSEIARALNAPLSSCLYLVRALEERGYLYSVGTRKQIYPTRKLYELGQNILLGESWIDRLEPMLSALRDVTRETVILGKRQNTKIVYLAVFESSQTIRYSSRVGDLKPLHASSMGKALLASLPKDERKKLVSKLTLEAITAATITDNAALLADVERAAQRGYSETRGEGVTDVMAIAKTISLPNDTYGVAIAGPIYRMAAEADQLIRKLNEACAQMLTLAAPHPLHPQGA